MLNDLKRKERNESSVSKNIWEMLSFFKCFIFLTILLRAFNMKIFLVNFQDYTRDIIQHFHDFLFTENFLNKMHINIFQKMFLKNKLGNSETQKTVAYL